MADHEPQTADGSVTPSPGQEDRLSGIEHTTRESLELLRSLVALLLAKEAGHEGPRLEDLLAAIIAQQRELLAVQRATRRDLLVVAGSERGITVSAPTNDDAAAISNAIRGRLRARGEIAVEEKRSKRRCIARSISAARPATSPLPPATGCVCSAAAGDVLATECGRSAITATWSKCSGRMPRSASPHQGRGRIC